nr:CidA/LrgA family protein [Pseudomonas brassicae]
MTSLSLKHAVRLVAELGVLLALYLMGSQLCAWLHWPLPGGVIGMALLLLVFASGWVKPATLQAGAGLLMAEMLLFFIPALMSLLDYGPLLGGVLLKYLPLRTRWRGARCSGWGRMAPGSAARRKWAARKALWRAW